MAGRIPFPFALPHGRNRDHHATCGLETALTAHLGYAGSAATEADTSVCLREAVQHAMQAAKAAGGAVWRYDAVHRSLVLEVAVCVGQSVTFPTTCPLGEGSEGVAAASGQILNLSSTAGTPAMREDLQARGLEAMLCVPLWTQNRSEAERHLLGVFVLAHTRRQARFTAQDVERTGWIASGAAAALLAWRTVQSQRLAVVQTLQTIMALLDARDISSQEHSRRVAALCDRIAGRMGLEPAVVAQLHTGALLHDIGKVAIPEAILRKPGRLTASELAVLKDYPVIGYNLCAPLGLDAEVLMLIRNHTERLDGSGYPDGLQMGEIPLPLRILGVADAFDAMSSYRPYRERMDATARRQQLNRFAGSQFDPSVVEVLKRLLDEGVLDDLYTDLAPSQEVSTSESLVLKQAA